MDELIEYLGKQPKEVILYIILKLMQDNKIDFVDIANAHVEHLEQLKKGESEELMKLRAKIVCMWCDNKKNIGKNIRKLMQEAKDNGWANISQEQIDNSKWK